MNEEQRQLLHNWRCVFGTMDEEEKSCSGTPVHVFRFINGSAGDFQPKLWKWLEWFFGPRCAAVFCNSFGPTHLAARLFCNFKGWRKSIRKRKQWSKLQLINVCVCARAACTRVSAWVFIVLASWHFFRAHVAPPSDFPCRCFSYRIVLLLASRGQALPIYENNSTDDF